MQPSRARRVIALAMRCYSPRWRSRHGDEATMLAEALLDEGVAWWSIALSFLGGATRERVVHMPSRRVGTALVAVVMGVTAVPLALFASLAPASASSVNVMVIISKPDDAVHQLEAAFASHHFKIIVNEEMVPAELVGSILSVNTTGSGRANVGNISEVHGVCVGGTAGCVDGLIVPRHFSGTAHVTIGRLTVSANGRRR